jgi:hypothetical protein
MTGTPIIPPEETAEGNVTEIDLENRSMLIEDRTGAPFMKLFWNKVQEEFDGHPTALINQIRKLKQGYYVAPVIGSVDESISGKIKEAYIKALPYKERPADFPRSQNKRPFGSGAGGRPRNEKIIAYQTCYKEACETIRALVLQPDAVLDEVEFNRLMDIAVARAKKDGKDLCDAAGVTP